MLIIYRFSYATEDLGLFTSQTEALAPALQILQHNQVNARRSSFIKLPGQE